MRGARPISVRRLFFEETITKNTSEDSRDIIDLNHLAQNGNFSIQIYVETDGIIKVQYSLCCEKVPVNFLVPADATDICSGFEDDSGPGGDGRAIYSFQPELARWMKIKVSETGTSNNGKITLDLCTQ